MRRMTSRGVKWSPRFLVGLFAAAHHQILEQVAHLKVVDRVGMKIDLGHGLC